MIVVRRFLTAVTLFSLVVANAWSLEAPGDVVRGTTDQVLARVKSDREALRRDPASMYALVAELIFPHFDFPIMSQWVLGTHWKTAEESSRAAFIEEFRKLLVRTYATALLEFSDQAISYPEANVGTSERTALVSQEIEQTGSEPILLGYRLHNTSGAWKVFDVTVDGVSLVKTYRASFSSIIEDGGIAHLIETLREKNKEIGQ